MVLDQEGVKLMFRQRTSTAQLLEDKKRCKEVCDVWKWCRGRWGAFIDDVWGKDHEFWQMWLSQFQEMNKVWMWKSV